MTESAPKPRRLFSRRNVILLGIAAGLVGLLGVTQTWISVPPPSSDVQLGEVQVSGADAASAVLALAVVGLACAVAATIAGKIARFIVAGVQFLVGAGVVGFVIPVLLDPHKAAAAKVAAAYGLQTVADADYRMSFWPIVSMLGGLLMMVAALALGFSSRRWSSGRRYERTSGGRAVVTNQTMDDIDRWDAFTEGEDPTEGDGDVKGARYH